MNAFELKLSETNGKAREREALEILQVNLGDMCNQTCVHCHVSAGPSGYNIMSKETMDKIISFLEKKNNLTLDITGGAPEMNPNFKYFVDKARPLAKEIIVRSNLTVLLEKGQEETPDFFKEKKVRVVSSMPCYTKENVDKQRGEGVFEKSIKALKILNSKGFGKKTELNIDLVYNPGGAFLPGAQCELEKAYKKELKEGYDIEFNGLITMINAPIKRFKDYLDDTKQYDKYMDLLRDNFNKEVSANVMCRNLLSVGWDGKVYDCDFNQAVNMPVTDANGIGLSVDDIDPEELEKMDIKFGEHCFCCTAGLGSSCQGALKKNEE